ncbi:uncharacterized protein LOC118195797 [Stegodyphus dumicola]|uniref:uncharacterized protein LOC118195797 n=1 Tax=Stegodyphus dumicola TaxID=202533 RepID=UPI0015B055D8|nr:uncharacterized protein LOC118195797 [Stegodyphus dumicola]
MEAGQVSVKEINAVQEKVKARQVSVKEEMNVGQEKLINLADVPTADELKNAKEFWIRRIQGVAYDKGILRLEGRLQFSDFRTEEKHPILLPRNKKFTEMIIEREYVKLMHSGVTVTLTTLQKEYWPTACEEDISKLSYLCKKVPAKPARQTTVQLPKDRIVETPPFL